MRTAAITPRINILTPLRPKVRASFFCAVLKVRKEKYFSQIGAFFLSDVCQLNTRKPANIGCSRV